MRHAIGVLDKTSPVPLYYQLYLRLRAEIQAGIARPGDLLGTEKDIQTRFGVSRATVRRALDQLALTGQLMRITGRGTFVTDPPFNIHVPHLLSFTEELHRRGMTPAAHVLEFGTVAAPEAVAGALGCRTGHSVLHIRRLRTGDGTPIVLVDHYLAPGLMLDPSELEQSLYATLEGVLGVRLQEGLHRVYAGLSTEEESALLEIKQREAVLRFDRTTLGSDGRPVIHEHGTGRADFYDYTVHLHRQVRP